MLLPIRNRKSDISILTVTHSNVCLSIRLWSEQRYWKKALKFVLWFGQVGIGLVGTSTILVLDFGTHPYGWEALSTFLTFPGPIYAVISRNFSLSIQLKGMSTVMWIKA